MNQEVCGEFLKGGCSIKKGSKVRKVEMPIITENKKRNTLYSVVIFFKFIKFIFTKGPFHEGGEMN